jgi:hypothetical protein
MNGSISLQKNARCGNLSAKIQDSEEKETDHSNHLLDYSISLLHLSTESFPAIGISFFVLSLQAGGTFRSGARTIQFCLERRRCESEC